MKKRFLVILITMFCTGLFCSEWAITESKPTENFYLYTVTAAPQGYESTVGTNVYTWIGTTVYKNLYSEQCLNKILEFLDAGKFELKPEDGYDIIFLPVEFIDLSKSKISQEQLKYIWKNMSKHYAGLSDMKKKGFSKKELLNVTTALELQELLDKYIEDCHFNLVAGDLVYQQSTSYDEGFSPSTDPYGTYFEKETSNAYYVRFNECQSDVYLRNFKNVGEKALNKKYLILDARTNGGGNNRPQQQVRNYLNSKKYKGTVVILQDNRSCSSGEVMEMFDKSKCNFKVLLVGTHSAGMQNYGNVQEYQDKNIFVYLRMGRTSFRNYIPSNYLGEGKGYKPDVWATTQNMKSVLESLGIDTADIEFNQRYGKILE